MFYRTAADFVLISHFAFIILVVAGALAVYRYPWFIWVHIPAASWGTFVELTGRICPLTTLENSLRSSRAGLEGYTSSFVEQYILPVIYPAGLTGNLQLVLAGLVVAVNVVIYAAILFRRKTAQQKVTPT